MAPVKLSLLYAIEPAKSALRMAPVKLSLLYAMLPARSALRMAPVKFSLLYAMAADVEMSPLVIDSARLSLL